jgi:F-type H+-transporting ATPase subunit a
MQGIKVFSYTRWYPFSSLGLTSSWWTLHEETIVATWVVLAFIVLFIIAARIIAYKKNEVALYGLTSFIRYFMDMTKQSLGDFNFNHFAFITSLFIFILLCNIINVIVPWVEEPTSDLNTTLALGIISFFYVQGATIRAEGIRGYIKELATPVFLFPLHVIGKLATIVSISLRLFGNIFGSSIIVQLYNRMKMGSIFFETGLLITGANMMIMLFFGIFEGLIQAYVFCMLTLTYLTIGLQHEEGEDFV